tara:strand:+ start:345 stop:1103 length:759 start_codon:yes stop_codon:yes gene_type:complete
MDVSQTIKTNSSEGLIVTDLSDNIANQKYHFYLLDISKNCSIFSNNVISSFICIDGSASVNGKNIAKFEGFHVPPLQKLEFESKNLAKVLLGSTEEIDFSISNKKTEKKEEIIPLSDYKVEKPWGFENWYTDNLDNPKYALKRIHMEKGFQSSLQSHEYKSETNFVIDGEALVLYGLDAPPDINTEIVIDDLSRKIYSPLTGWSNRVNELHRVIAHTSYDAIEISTPELDDVIRWADDNDRSSGRIDTEHNE